jgi:hypothetical protein
VTPHTFDKFDGIIGTDILSDMNAIIDCQSNNIRIDNPVDRSAPTTAPLHCGVYQAINKQQYAEISKMTPKLNKKQKKKTLQLIVKECQVIPPQSHMLVKAYFRLNPLLNTTFEIPQSMLRADGVFIGHSIVKIQADGSVVVPMANFSNRPYILKRKRIFALARIVPPGSDPPARRSPDDMGNDQPANLGKVKETPEKADDSKNAVHLPPTSGDVWDEAELLRTYQASQKPTSNSSTPPSQEGGATSADSTNSSRGNARGDERQQPDGQGHSKAESTQQSPIVEQGKVRGQGTSSQPKSSTPNSRVELEEILKKLEESRIANANSRFDSSRFDSSSEDEPGLALFDMPTPPSRPSTPHVRFKKQDSFTEPEPDTSTIETMDSTVIEANQDESDNTVKMDDQSETSVVVTEVDDEPYFPKGAATLNYLELLQPRNTLPEVGEEALQWLEKRDRAAIRTLEGMIPATTDALAMPNPDDSRAYTQGRCIAEQVISLFWACLAVMWNKYCSPQWANSG